ncbi:MSMEG_1061 family FMN-dependent PPOX-type flavoprotein [Wenxinia marina]|uniref:PPOX class probable FMN-dependent enzyme family n=1 Tax=Wenxinia marina DSM 24838 TaxID=1123501 RepID=A0A0D0NRG1_9RHOB|nr:MSMEG_1061 family FMN-dependent PPOX-type flavoprotein [Wenxinia marina]KIQ70805.1 PPOX class probable FMN-dependent enzyme family [Wenxinia marina DSM 24838]GGL57158.1 pyridoxamine 5'-phosphate oxidase-related FMN-binding protein [Wenxinia marina]
MRTIDDIAALEALYGAPGEASLIKVAPRLTPLYRRWIAESRFCILTTVGPEGTDASPRGDDGPVVEMPDDGTILLPDWRGNNRMDSLRNIVRDGRVSLMFMVPGSANVVRVNGIAVLTDDAGVLGRFDRDGARPRTVTVVTVAEVYSQCARAILRAGLWSGEDRSAALPTVGELLAEAKTGFDGAAYDAEWSGRAARTMW